MDSTHNRGKGFAGEKIFLYSLVVRNRQTGGLSPGAWMLTNSEAQYVLCAYAAVMLPLAVVVSSCIFASVQSTRRTMAGLAEERTVLRSSIHHGRHVSDGDEGNPQRIPRG